MVPMRGYVRVLGCLLLLGLVGGCVSLQTPTYQPAVDTTQALLGHRDSHLRVGAFTASPGVPNTALSVRGSQLNAGGDDGTFSSYLRNALVIELKTVGRFDEHAAIEIAGNLARNQLQAGTRIGSATVAARFTVRRAGATVYDKSLSVSHQWDSSFMGTVAIPAAVQNYSDAFQKLIFKLVTDPDFIKATSPGRSEVENAGNKRDVAN